MSLPRRALAWVLWALLCATALSAHASEGISFACPPARWPALRADMARYLQQLHIPTNWLRIEPDFQAGTLSYQLRRPAGHSSTLRLAQDASLQIPWEHVSLVQPGRKPLKVRTTSRKEIMLALMHPGRQTTLTGAACDVHALQEHVGLRQNIVAWAEHLHWIWPDGGSASWNTRYWDAGTPHTRWPLEQAMHDVFVNQKLYGIGCYTATKLVVVQGVLDYYRRVHPHAGRSKLILARLMANGDPLVQIEPPAMWSFESGFEASEQPKPGKLVHLLPHVAAGHFVPGDWVYVLNTHAPTYAKTGYEGSNAIYLGRNRFDDYYDDHQHAYTYEEKLNEVYQWRHGVFSRTRDADKAQALSEQDYARLGLPPEQGGLVMPYRVVPFFFGFEPLPPLQGP